jgi:hypothetical protein
MKTITLTEKQFATLNSAVREAYIEVSNAEERDAVNSLIDTMSQQTAEHITPQMAHQKLTRVRAELDTLIALGESYAHFQSAQATHKYLKKAKNTLKGLS